MRRDTAGSLPDNILSSKILILKDLQALATMIIEEGNWLADSNI